MQESSEREIARSEQRWRVLLGATMAFPVLYLFAAAMLRGRPLLLTTLVGVVLLAGVAAWTSAAFPRDAEEPPSLDAETGGHVGQSSRSQNSGSRSKGSTSR